MQQETEGTKKKIAPTRPKGIPLIVCECSKPAWPLLVQRKSTSSDRAFIDIQVVPQWQLDNWHCTRDLDRIIGVCPQCIRRFTVHIPEDYALEACAERNRQVKLRGVPRQQAQEAVEKRLMLDIRKMEKQLTFSPNIRLTTQEERQSEYNDTIALPSPGGPQKLRLTSQARKEFAKACHHAWSDGAKDGRLYPNWLPNGKDEEFIAWTKQLQE